MGEVDTLRIAEARARVEELSSESKLGIYKHHVLSHYAVKKSFEPLNQLSTLQDEFEYCSTHYLKI
jgi:hypothetical protein